MINSIKYYFFNKKHIGLLTYDEYIAFSKYSNLFYIRGNEFIYDLNYSSMNFIKRIYIQKNENGLCHCCLEYNKRNVSLNNVVIFTPNFLEKTIITLLEKFGDTRTRNKDHYTNEFIRHIETRLLDSGLGIAEDFVSNFDKKYREEFDNILIPFKDLGFYISDKVGFIRINDRTYTPRSEITKYGFTNKIGILIRLGSEYKYINNLANEIDHLSENISILYPDFTIDVYKNDIDNREIDRNTRYLGFTFHSVVIYRTLPFNKSNWLS